MTITLNTDGTYDVTLTPTQWDEACRHSVRVRAGSVMRERHGIEGFGGHDSLKRLESNVCGFEAELAVSVLLTHLGYHAPWNKLERAAKNDADVGDNVQVRWARHGGLVYRRGDPIEHVYVLVWGAGPTYTVLGWLPGHDAADMPMRALARGKPAAHVADTDTLSRDWTALPVARAATEDDHAEQVTSAAPHDGGSGARLEATG